MSSGSIGDFQNLRKSNTKDVSTARNQDFSLIEPNEGQSGVSQNEQQRPTRQEPLTSSRYPSQECLSRHVKPCGSLQNGQEETAFQPTSSDPAGTAPDGELTHKHSKAEEQRQEGKESFGGQAEQLTNSKQVKARSESFNGSAVHSLATGSLRSFRRRKPQPWPNPQQSLGEIIETNNKKIKGNVWIAEGPALGLFEAQIRPQIERLLHNSEPPQCAPLLLSLYMIGKDKTSASPIIMICCCDRKVRKDAEATIRESDVLQQFPQMGLGNSATLLETDSFLIPVTGRATESHRHASNFPSSFEEEHIIGRRLRLIDKAGKTVRFATGGPFIRIDKHIYQLTAFHYGPGYASTDPTTQLDSDSDGCEYDGQSDTDQDESGVEEETAEKAPINEPFSMSLEGQSASLSMEYGKDVVVEEHDPQDPWNPRTLLSRNIDYDLVRLPAAEASQASNTTKDYENYHSFQVTDIGELPVSRTIVVVVTSYNLLTGAILPGIKRVKMHGFFGFQDLVTARLSCSVKTGDSGSAVFDASTGCLYGHIVLGSAPNTLVYIVPSVNIFTNLVAKFGKLPTLNLEAPILDSGVQQGIAHRREHGMNTPPDPTYNLHSIPGPQQRQWFDHDPAVTDPKDEISSNAGQTQMNWDSETSTIWEDGQIAWNYEKPQYDFSRHRCYWEGWRRDGSRVRHYPPVGT